MVSQRPSTFQNTINAMHQNNQLSSSDKSLTHPLKPNIQRSPQKTATETPEFVYQGRNDPCYVNQQNEKNFNSTNKQQENSQQPYGQGIDYSPIDNKDYWRAGKGFQQNQKPTSNRIINKVNTKPNFKHFHSKQNTANSQRLTAFMSRRAGNNNEKRAQSQARGNINWTYNNNEATQINLALEANELINEEQQAPLKTELFYNTECAQNQSSLFPKPQQNQLPNISESQYKVTSKIRGNARSVIRSISQARGPVRNHPKHNTTELQNNRLVSEPRHATPDTINNKIKASRQVYNQDTSAKVYNDANSNNNASGFDLSAGNSHQKNFKVYYKNQGKTPLQNQTHDLIYVNSEDKRHRDRRMTEQVNRITSIYDNKNASFWAKKKIQFSPAKRRLQAPYYQRMHSDNFYSQSLPHNQAPNQAYLGPNLESHQSQASLPYTDANQLPSKQLKVTPPRQADIFRKMNPLSLNIEQKLKSIDMRFNELNTQLGKYQLMTVDTKKKLMENQFKINLTNSTIFEEVPALSQNPSTQQSGNTLVNASFIKSDKQRDSVPEESFRSLVTIAECK